MHDLQDQVDDFLTFYLPVESFLVDKLLINCVLKWILLKIRAIIAKIIYQKSTHSTETFEILFKTTHFTSFL